MSVNNIQNIVYCIMEEKVMVRQFGAVDLVR